MIKYIKADWFSKMDEIRESAEQEMVEKLKQRFPNAKISDPFHTKRSGDRILMTINGKRVYVYFLDEIGEDGKPWFCVATDLKNLQGYSGNVDEVVDYIENNLEMVYSSKRVCASKSDVKASNRIRKGEYIKSGEVVDSDNIEADYFKAYGKELDLNTVPCVIARDTFLSGWGVAEGQKAYQVVLCSNSFEMHNIEYSMKRVAKSEGLANIRCSFGINPNRLNGTVSFKIGRYARAWNTELSDRFYEEEIQLYEHSDI